MTKNGRNSQVNKIISLIFTMRNLTHEKMEWHLERKMSPLQIIALHFVHKKSPTMKEIADHLTITAPSATSLIGNLLKEGMVEKKAEKEDRRVVRIVATTKGKCFLKKGLEQITRRISRNLEVLTSTEQKKLAEILGKIVDHLRNKKI